MHSMTCYYQLIKKKKPLNSFKKNIQSLGQKHIPFQNPEPNS